MAGRKCVGGVNLSGFWYNFYKENLQKTAHKETQMYIFVIQLLSFFICALLLKLHVKYLVQLAWDCSIGF